MRGKAAAVDGGAGGAAGSCVRTSLSITSREGGREKAGRGLFNFVLKELVHAECFQTHL